VSRSILLLACVLIARSAGAQALQTTTETAHTGTTATSTAASAPATTAQSPTTSSQATFRSNVDLVALNVVVTDSDQKYVSGLDAADFAVFEDGIQQDVSFFGASNVPLDLAILLDTSASMTGKMQLVQQAAIGFLDTLRTGDRAIIVDIKDATKIMYPLGNDMEAAKQAILATAPKGGTALYNGAYLTLKEMVKERRTNGDVRRQALVVLSDGDDTASLVTYDDLMDLAKQSGIAIYTITMRSKYLVQQAASRGHSYFSQSEFGMKALAQETGARSFFPTELSELSGVYASIAEELATQYAIGYSSKNPRMDGSYRRVIVRIADKPGVRTRTRAGYTAPRAQRTASAVPATH
jgi:Ca-activated chloride channel family protein